MRKFDTPLSRVPEVQFLSNGRYTVAITNAGGGYSSWGDLAITRWREDTTRDCWGTFIYLRDLASGEFWSTAYQPTLRLGESYEVTFGRAHAEFSQTNGDLETLTEICVPAQDDVELRRITLTNHSSIAHSIELTSYAEVVLASSGADSAHPAFSNLFVQTEFLPASSLILCTRRPRSEAEQTAWLFHLIGVEAEMPGLVSCETDRARFLGRGRTPQNPAALESDLPLSNTVGSVLDPIIALRRRVELAPGEAIRVYFVLGVAERREMVLTQAEKYRSHGTVSEAFVLARHGGEAGLQNFDDTEIETFERLAGALIYTDPARRGTSFPTNRRGQRALWGYGVSGDFPIALLRIGNPDKIGLVKRLIEAHAYWKGKGLATELIFLNEAGPSSQGSLHETIAQLISGGLEPGTLDKRAGIFVRDLAQIGEEGVSLLQSAARVVLSDEFGLDPLNLPGNSGFSVPRLQTVPALLTEASPAEAPRDLRFQNGLGGFSADGREYVITLKDGQVTPAPWVNVLANPLFGTVISESGAAYSWAGNSHEFRLTPWSNDPVTDTPGEAFYIRDEETGRFWSPTPGPVRGSGTYVIRHGFGYSIFEHVEENIGAELTIFVAIDAPVKVALLKLRNYSPHRRRLAVFGYWEWVLGDLRQKNSPYVQTELDIATGALLARNYYNSDFSEQIAFVDVNDPTRTITGDRTEFLGRNRGLANPESLERTHLSGRVGEGLDPCGAIQVSLDLQPGQEQEISFRLGSGRDLGVVQGLINQFRATAAPGVALEAVTKYWAATLSTLQVETPDPSVNLMANGWLLYQTLGCRLWGRTGFYQSGGAYGFRDQLQDVMALVHAEPALTREQLLRAAAHQFKEGDVLHWWHPPAGRGVRTHVSDDYLWLPYIAWRYVTCVGDVAVLDEQIHFLEGRILTQEEESDYSLPNRSEESGSLYEHCVRAIKNGLKFGVHGLPLMGGGDWNDGMNLVGKEGRGESVWLGFFLYEVLTRFASLARRRSDFAFADFCVLQARQLQGNIEEHAWDGKWYRRAYFDNGEPLGSHTNLECQIDSISQSWSVISGAGDKERTKQAMQSVAERLVRPEAGLIQLLDPPFDRSALHPGYIQGYVPGVRENGGQYTHAAVWATTAFALLGDNEKAWELATLLNPIHHGATEEGIATYKVEPYVIAADIYWVPPHTGRGGWTWYTGSAGWMYRLLTETLLGFNKEGDRLRLLPRLPKSWSTYKIIYRYGQTRYRITISQVPKDSRGSAQTFLDGKAIDGETIPLVDDGKEHQVERMVHSS